MEFGLAYGRPTGEFVSTPARSEDKTVPHNVRCGWVHRNVNVCSRVVVDLNASSERRSRCKMVDDVCVREGVFWLVPAVAMSRMPILPDCGVGAPGDDANTLDVGAATPVPATIKKMRRRLRTRSQRPLRLPSE